MNISKLEQLLQQNESASLEFKRELDLTSNAGKAKLLREILSLANSLNERAYLIIGVDDETRRPVGLKHPISEEQIQQIVQGWCRPPIELQVEVQEYHDRQLCIITVISSRPPHTTKKDFSADENGGKISLREKEVYVRRGSTIDVATPEEIIEMAQKQQSNLDEIDRQLDKTNYWLEEIASEVRGLSSHQETDNEPPNRYLETVFVGMLSILSATLLPVHPDLQPLLFLAGYLFWAVALSALRLTHFGLIRALLTGIVFTPLASAGFRLLFERWTFTNHLLSHILLAILIGWFAGILTTAIASRFER
ncbi:MAG: putative DNA binding domain-containing protein [Chloroflexota bacterium]|jgi:hypothetical protein